ncbi:hypothetical protein [Aeromicrobium fastidiosum]|uniref:Uncharacterized protein n=1 Tax=Aeromicrobium fastidiosum TaxID=52699 RepID=A0A641AKT0_9ACTN|nr:hypothetical protein [Aeromicrobium fastidiosum]KAA1376425.1 hypothetical protein ESP62_013435 [Aeromicrobium fastidiosum]MBP2391662.1 hypothetical protein [Aeromicrobium fastidiosum]
MKGRPSGYAWEVRGKEVVISHHGAESAVLRGERAHQFVREVEKGDPQLLMARIAGGTYKAPDQRRSGPKPKPRGRR